MPRLEEFDDVQLDVEFTQAGTRSNLTSNENIAISFGKISKWYEALVPTGGSSGQFLAWNSSGTAKWVANPNVDTKVTSTLLAQSTAAATYLPTFVSAAGNSGVNIMNSFSFGHTVGTTSAVGNSRIILGNATASGTANNEEGQIVLYSSGTSYHTIKGSATSSTVTHSLPTTGGTILNTGTTSFTRTLTSGTKIGSIKINGTSQDIYAPTNTNTTYTLSGAYGSSSNTWVTTLTPSSGSATTSTVPTASTSVYGITKLSSATNSTSTALAATASAVKSAYDLANGKSTVSFSASLTTGTKVGTITIDGTSTDLYCQTNTNTDTKVTDTVGTANTYYPAGGTSTSTATGTQVFDTSLKFIGTTGTTSAVGKAQLVLGNSTASGTANNKQGSLVVYGSTAYAHTIQGAPTAARTLTLPNKTGTFALTSDIPSVPTVNDAALTLKGSGTTVTTFTANASSAKSLDIVAGSNVTVTADATNSKISIASSHPTITKSTDTTSTASPAHGGTFTTVDSVTRDGNGHVTKINTKTVTLPADSNTDTLVSQTFATADKNRPLLMSYYDTGVQTTTAQIVHRNDALFFNPSSGILRSPRLYLQTTGMPITINLDTLQPAAGENVDVLSVRYKNTDGTATHTVYPIGILGNSATGSGATNNSGVRLGSTNGTTVVGAGESSVNFAAAQAKYNDENLYFVADQAVYMYTNCSNDATTVTGPWRVGGFTTGTSAITSGRVMITDGTTGGFKASDYTIAKSVPSDAKFSDTVTTVTTSGSGNAVTSITASNGALTVTKGSTFSLSNHTHTTTIAANSGTNQLTLAASTKYKLTTGGTNFIFTTPPNTTYSAGTGLSLSGTTFNHSNSVTAETTFDKSRFKYDAQGHITESGYYVHTASGTNNTGGWIKIATMKHIMTYDNTPIMLTISQRGNYLTYRLHIQFTNSNTTDPPLGKFIISTDESETEVDRNPRAYMIKTTAGTWDLYIQKKDFFEALAVTEFDVGKYFTDHMTWTWQDVQTADSEITGGTEAERILPFNAYQSRTANTVLAAPNGSNGTASFRKLVAADIPSLNYSKVSISRNLTSGTKVGTITIDGTATDLYCQTNTNTDTKVTQSASTAEQYRPLILGAKYSSTVSELSQTVTDQVYVTTKMYAQASTGKIYATEFITNTYPSASGSSMSQYGLYLKSYKKASLPAGGDYSYSRAAVRVYDGKAGDSSGMLLTMDSGGLTIVGGGESATSLASLISDDQRDSNTSRTRLDVGGTLGTSFQGSSEQLILSSDANIYFLTNCNTVADRKPVVLDTDSAFYPGTTKTGSIGTSSYYWNTAYIDSLNLSNTSVLSKASGDTYYYAERSDTDVSVGFGVGSGGINHGLYSWKLGGWMICGNATDVLVRANLYNPSTEASLYALPLFGGTPSTGAHALYNNNGFRYSTLEGTTSAAGLARLVLGNSTASGTAGNKRGTIRLYSQSSSYIDLIPSSASTARTITIPAVTATMAINRKGLITDSSSDFASYAWHKFAEVTITTSNYDYVATFLVSSGFDVSSTYVPRKIGVLTMHVRTGSTRIFTSGQFEWLFAGEQIDPRRFVMVYTDTANTSCKVELWYKQIYRYEGYTFNVVEEHTRTVKEIYTMTIYDQSGHGSASYTTGTGTLISQMSKLQTGDHVLSNSTNIYTHTISTDTYKTRDITVSLNDVEGIMGTDVLCYSGYETNTADDTTLGSYGNVSNYSSSVSFSGYLSRFSYFTVLLCVGTDITARTTIHVSAIGGYQSYQLIWGGAPSQTGGNLSITSGLVNISDSSGTITMTFGKCTSYWIFSATSSTYTKASTPDIHVLKVYGHCIRSNGYH